MRSLPLNIENNCIFILSRTVFCRFTLFFLTALSPNYEVKRFMEEKHSETLLMDHFTLITIVEFLHFLRESFNGRQLGRVPST